ncbi:MAG: nicotinamide mononucleotide transporter [Bacteroidales bacterium]|nr:nicotinamide mononucleotide transporter [Bacteroidales bacterium]
MDYLRIITDFALLTALAFMTMQIFQHKWMWYADILTAMSTLVVVLMNTTADGEWAPLWAQVAMNAYFTVMAVVGIISWKKIARQAGEKEGEEAPAMRIKRLDAKTIGITAAMLAVMVPLIYYILSHTNDSHPLLDSLGFSFSIVATWWLTRAHAEEWLLWIIADLFIVIIFFLDKNYTTMFQYIAYIISCVIGFIYWKKKGTYVD